MGPLDELADRLPDGAVSTHPGELRTRGHDAWPLAALRERRGDAAFPPQALVFARSTEDVAATLAWAAEHRTPVVPRGGGSAVVGAAHAVRGGIVLELSEMDRVLGIDEDSLAVHVQAGARGDRLEGAVEERGLTLGHYPDSLSVSTVGGWIASRSAGQASAGYGPIEDLILGLTVVLAGGRTLRLRAAPRSAAGPDLRRLFAGSEGTLGVVTEAVLSVARAPGDLSWLAFGLPTFERAIALVRALSQADVRPLVLRAHEKEDATRGTSGTHPEGSVVLVGLPQARPGLEGVIRAIRHEAAEARAGSLPSELGSRWWRARFDTVYLYQRANLESPAAGESVLVDAIEVAGLWSDLPALYEGVRAGVAERAASVGCRLAHPYRSGASLEFTFVIRAADDTALERAYLACWADAIRACHRVGGTMTHHHGVGLLRNRFMEEELGAEGLHALRALKRALDPDGILNPGKLLPHG